MKAPMELLPVIEWWNQGGKKTVMMIGAVVLIAGCYYAGRALVTAKKAAGAEAALSMQTPEEVQEAAERFGGQACGPAIKMRLAQDLYHAGKFEEAMAVYEDLMKKPAEGFAEVPVIGKACCLEGLERFDEAKAMFDSFAESNPGSFLMKTAQLGSIRCQAQAGDREGAVKRLEELKAGSKDEAEKAALDEQIDLVRRYVKPAAPVAPATVAEDLMKKVEAAAPAALAEEKPEK